MYKFTNNEFMALLSLNTDFTTPYPNCMRHELEPKSSIYVHDRAGFSFYAATGPKAELFCKELLGLPTKTNGHGHMTWYLYDGTRYGRVSRNHRREIAA